MKHFSIIDMQNDFTTGARPNKDAVDIIPKIKDRLNKARLDKAHVIYTRDTHSAENYMASGEGKYLPVPHCIKGTDGWQIVNELCPNQSDLVIDKLHFGYDGWKDFIKPGDEVTMVGTCTDICVVSNALAIKMIENVDVTVLSDCCAGLTKEKHQAALEVMKSCQCKVI